MLSDKQLEVLMKKYLPKIMKAIQIDYSIGSAITIQNAKISGFTTSMSPLSMTKQQQQANISMIKNLLGDVNSEAATKINYLVNKNITEHGTDKQLADDLDDLFKKDTVGHFSYKNKFKRIAVTESTRIMNESANNTATRLGAKKKYLAGINDAKQGADSKIALAKYGSEEKAIPIDKPFEYTSGKTHYRYMLPPNRPNDREFVYYIFE